MSKTIVRPTLSLGNHIYLYRLLRDAIGCGKQTFMTQVEETLAAGDMTAYDLGFESTRELLEELDDCIKLTVFKGGRLYATVIANEAWDTALAKGEDKPKAAKGAKQSYKKKKRGEKDLKAVRPKHVKRPELETVAEVAPEPEPEAEIEVAIEVAAEAETEIAAMTDPEVMSEQEAAAELNEAPKSTTEEAAGQPETPAFQNSDVFGDEAEGAQSDEPADQDATESTPEPASAPAVDLSPLRRRHARHRRRVLLDRPRARYHRGRAKPRKLPPALHAGRQAPRSHRAHPPQHYWRSRSRLDHRQG